MINKTLAAALLVVTSAMTAPANAVVITFDDLGGPTVNWVHPLVTDNVVFWNSFGTDRALGIWGDDNSNINADPNGYTLFNGYGGTTTIVHKGDGGTFDLYSIDIADVFDSNFYGEGGDILFNFIYDGGATSSQTVTIDALPGLQTFHFNQKGLRDFSYTPQTPLGSVQIDNVVLDQLGNVTVDQRSVPEPATWAMMIAGFGLVGGAMRRRRSAEKLVAV